MINMISKVDEKGRFYISKKIINNNQFILDYDLEELYITLSPLYNQPHHH